MNANPKVIPGRISSSGQVRCATNITIEFARRAIERHINRNIYLLAAGLRYSGNAQ